MADDLVLKYLRSIDQKLNFMLDDLKTANSGVLRLESQYAVLQLQFAENSVRLVKFEERLAQIEKRLGPDVPA